MKTKQTSVSNFLFFLVMSRNKNGQKVALGFDEKQYEAERLLNIVENKVVIIIQV